MLTFCTKEGILMKHGCMYFYMPSNYTVGDTEAIHVVIKPSCNGGVLVFVRTLE